MTNRELNEQMLNETIYQNIAAAVREKGVLMKDFETSVGVSEGYFSRKRAGGTIPLLTMVRVAEGLEMPILDVMDAKTADVFAMRELDRQIEEQEAVLADLRARRAAFDN